MTKENKLAWAATAIAFGFYFFGYAVAKHQEPDAHAYLIVATDSKGYYVVTAHVQKGRDNALDYRANKAYLLAPSERAASAAITLDKSTAELMCPAICEDYLEPQERMHNGHVVHLVAKNERRCVPEREEQDE